jgi:hypothetical protein
VLQPALLSLGVEVRVGDHRDPHQPTSARRRGSSATRSWGSFLMKPTVSETRMRGTVSGWRARTVVSSVANSLSSDQHAAAGEQRASTRTCRRWCSRPARPSRARGAACGACRRRARSRPAPRAAPRCGRAPCGGRARASSRPAPRPPMPPPCRSAPAALAQPRRQVREPRDLDLEARLAAARMALEDREDHRGAVEHLGAGRALEVAGLRGRQVVVDEHDGGALAFGPGFRRRLGGVLRPLASLLRFLLPLLRRLAPRLRRADGHLAGAAGPGGELLELALPHHRSDEAEGAAASPIRLTVEPPVAALMGQAGEWGALEWEL